MARVKRGNKRRLKRKKILRRAKGYYLAKSKLYRIARERLTCPACSSKNIKKKMSASSFMGNSIGKCATNSPGGFS